VKTKNLSYCARREREKLLAGYLLLRTISTCTVYGDSVHTQYTHTHSTHKHHDNSNSPFSPFHIRYLIPVVREAHTKIRNVVFPAAAATGGGGGWHAHATGRNFRDRTELSKYVYVYPESRFTIRRKGARGVRRRLVSIMNNNIIHYYLPTLNYII